jgi:hypothetical protein
MPKRNQRRLGLFTKAVEVDAIGGKVYIARPQLPES